MTTSRRYSALYLLASVALLAGCPAPAADADRSPQQTLPDTAAAGLPGAAPGMEPGGAVPRPLPEAEPIPGPGTPPPGTARPQPEPVPQPLPEPEPIPGPGTPPPGTPRPPTSR